MIKKKQTLRPLDTPIYNYWQALYRSFYSSRLYIDVIKRWRGFGTLYLLLAIALASIPLSLRIMVDFDRYFEEKMILPLKSLPTLDVQNGQVSFDKPMPYLVKNKKGEVVSIVDTTGVVTGISAKYPQLTVLITKDKIFFRPPKVELFFHASTVETGDNVYMHTLNKDDNEVFMGEAWIKSAGLAKLKRVTLFLVYPMITMFFYALYTVFLFVLGFLGQLFAQILFNVKLKFKESCRLLAVAATPQIIFFFITLTADAMFFGLGYFYTAFIAIFYSYGVISIKRERAQMARV